jgi:RNA 3'-terminal phosphate cyclase (ATP)
MLAYTVLPLAILASAPCSFSVTGGLFQDHAPTALHMQNVLFPLLGRFGAKLSLQIERPGYVPKGGGRIDIRVERPAGPLVGLRMTDQGKFHAVRGVSLASHLQKEKVGTRMADESGVLLREAGYRPTIEVVEDSSAIQRGAALLVWAESGTGCIIGADSAGKQGRRSEQIAQKVVKDLLADIQTGSTVDRFAADQLILFAALAEGRTEYLIPKLTDHVESNVWLVREILGCKVEISGRSLVIQGIGFHPAEP